MHWNRCSSIDASSESRQPRLTALKYQFRTILMCPGLYMCQVGGRGGPCGLAHISEVADGFAADIHGQFHMGQGAHLLPDS